MLINVPWVMCNMLQCTGLLERAKPDPCGTGATGAGIPAAPAPGACGGGVLGKNRGWWLTLALTPPTLIFPKV